jgi:DNA-binding transcriptional ArsR family regulator
VSEFATDGGRLLKVMSALANRHRLRIVAALRGGRNYVSQLARDLRMSRPLLMLHLQKLEEAGLITGQLELSDDGRAMKYYTLEEFALTLTPETISQAAATLPPDKEER